MTHFTPVNQIRLTNVVVVRYKKGGKRFELACYPNKVTSWREGVEKDIDEVIQSDIIFENVNKGTYASENELKQIFGTDDMQKIRMEILQKGDLQVSEKERKHNTEELFKEIASIVTQKCVNPQTNRPLTITLVERAMKEDLHYSVHPSKPAKVQAMDVIKLLSGIKDFPIVRAQMRLTISLPKKDGKIIKAKLLPFIKTVESEDVNATFFVMRVLSEPENFRTLDELVLQETKGKGTLEVSSLYSDTADGDQSIE